LRPEESFQKQTNLSFFVSYKFNFCRNSFVANTGS
jgi:hypothetical protein